jgi:methylglutamate dehydrogenase subunit D
VAEPHDSLAITEAPGRDLVQLASWPATYPSARAALATLVGCQPPSDTRVAASAGEVTIFAVGPERLWLTAPPAMGLCARLRSALSPEEATVTELGHSRIVLRIEGALGPALLARAVPIDLDPASFTVGSLAQTGLHQVGVLLHRAGDRAFDLYLPRSYAQSMCEWLAETAKALR